MHRPAEGPAARASEADGEKWDCPCVGCGWGAGTPTLSSGAAVPEPWAHHRLSSRRLPPLSLQTLGHLEKAVVLELTLKHLKALTALTEQQHQKIVALQSGKWALGGGAEPGGPGRANTIPSRLSPQGSGP